MIILCLVKTWQCHTKIWYHYVKTSYDHFGFVVLPWQAPLTISSKNYLYYLYFVNYKYKVSDFKVKFQVSDFTVKGIVFFFFFSSRQGDQTRTVFFLLECSSRTNKWCFFRNTSEEKISLYIDACQNRTPNGKSESTAQLLARLNKCTERKYLPSNIISNHFTNRKLKWLQMCLAP